MPNVPTGYTHGSEWQLQQSERRCQQLKNKTEGPAPFQQWYNVHARDAQGGAGYIAMQGRRSCSNAEKDTVFERERKIATDESYRRRFNSGLQQSDQDTIQSGSLVVDHYQ